MQEKSKEKWSYLEVNMTNGTSEKKDVYCTWSSYSYFLIKSILTLYGAYICKCCIRIMSNSTLDNKYWTVKITNDEGTKMPV